MLECLWECMGHAGHHPLQGWHCGGANDREVSCWKTPLDFEYNADECLHYRDTCEQNILSQDRYHALDKEEEGNLAQNPDEMAPSVSGENQVRCEETMCTYKILFHSTAVRNRCPLYVLVGTPGDVAEVCGVHCAACHLQLRAISWILLHVTVGNPILSGSPPHLWSLQGYLYRPSMIN